MRLFAAVAGGARTAAQAWRLGLVLFLADLALAAGVAAAVAVAVGRAVDGTTAAERVASGLDLVAIAELWWTVAPTARALLPAVGGVLALAFAFGLGALAAVWAANLGERGAGPLGAAALRHWGAFVRVGLLALPLWAAAGVPAAVAVRALWKAGDPGGLRGVLLRLGTVLLAAVAYGLVSTIVTYARAEKLLRPETHGVRALLRAGRFVFRACPAATLGLAGLGACAWALAGALFAAISWWIPPGGWVTVGAVLAVRQTLVLSRVGIKVAWAGAELRLYRAGPANDVRPHPERSFAHAGEDAR